MVTLKALHGLVVGIVYCMFIWCVINRKQLTIQRALHGLVVGIVCSYGVYIRFRPSLKVTFVCQAGGLCNPN